MLRPTSPVILGALSATLLLSGAATAQNRALQQRLENAARIDCTFTTLVTGDWDGSETMTTAAPIEQEAAFFDIDVDEGTAEAEGRFGASFIVVRRASGYLHFMQMFGAGPLYLTTVLAEETTDGKLKAMHTRHEFSPIKLPGFTSRPELYLGECSVEPRAE